MRALRRRIFALADGLAPAVDLCRNVLEAAGAAPGLPGTCAELMRQGETILVFPGGGRDMLKSKGEEYRLQWQRRSGFARLAAAYEYPIVPVGLVGGDDGLGPTKIPRPQRMYLHLAAPIETSRPSDVKPEKWVDAVKERTRTALETTLAELRQLRATDPFRDSNPLAWRSAVQPR